MVEGFIMNKILIIPGVGLFENGIPDHHLFKLLKHQFPNYEIEWFNWKHKFIIPSVDGLSYKLARRWFCEIISDFQMVSKYAMDVEIPDADYYIGHSAGSILALLQSRPSIICGSPADTIDHTQEHSTVDYLMNSQPVYNIIHRRDIIAYPFRLPHVENEIIHTFPLSLTNWEPISAHTCYFNNKFICKKIVNKIKEWEQNNI